jgi:hypothetical protein
MDEKTIVANNSDSSPSQDSLLDKTTVHKSELIDSHVKSLFNEQQTMIQNQSSPKIWDENTILNQSLNDEEFWNEKTFVNDTTLGVGVKRPFPLSPGLSPIKRISRQKRTCEPSLLNEQDKMTFFQIEQLIPCLDEWRIKKRLVNHNPHVELGNHNPQCSLWLLCSKTDSSLELIGKLLEEKSIDSVLEEAKSQKKFFEIGLAPKIFKIWKNIESTKELTFTVMEKMSFEIFKIYQLYDDIEPRNLDKYFDVIISVLVEMFRAMKTIGLSHTNLSPRNIMFDYKDGHWKLVNFSRMATGYQPTLIVKGLLENLKHWQSMFSEEKSFIKTLLQTLVEQSLLTSDQQKDIEKNNLLG